MKQTLSTLIFILIASSAWAGQADVVKVRVDQSDDRFFTFHVTVRHDDTGWDHYANKWDVLAPDGKLLGTRVLMHPHVGEQPFTRSLSGIKIRPEIKEVTVRAHDSVHGYGGKIINIVLPE